MTKLCFKGVSGGAGNFAREASYGVRKGREFRMKEQLAIADRLGGET